MNADDMVRDRIIGEMYTYYTSINGIEPSVGTINLWKQQGIYLLKAKCNVMKEQHEKKIIF